MQNQTRFDGFAEADFVGEQNPRGIEQSFAGLVQLQEITQPAFRKPNLVAMLIFTVIDDQAVGLGQLEYLQDQPVLFFNSVALAETHPGQRRIGTRIDAGFTRCRKHDADGTVLNFNHHTQAKL